MLLPLGLWNSEATQRNTIFKLFDGYAYWHSEYRVHTKTNDIEKRERDLLALCIPFAWSSVQRCAGRLMCAC